MTEADTRSWEIPVDGLLDLLGSSRGGLTAERAANRLSQPGTAHIRRQRRSRLMILLKQFNNPIILLLFASAALSWLLEDATNAVIILVILLTSGVLSFWQELSAADAVAKLLAVIETKATVRRDGVDVELPLRDIVPGDIVSLRAGDLIPGDCRLLESKDLHVDEAALTGESFPVEKSAADLAAETPLSRRINALFLGTHVISGTATAVVIHTGRKTEFGRLSTRIEQRPPETGFERGLRNFGNLLIKITLALVTVVFAVNVAFHKPVVDSLLFALALAVGMTPQLLPAITCVVLAAGARKMARADVIVKQLMSIENFGSIDVLCSDKTGTLTEGVVQLQSAQNIAGEESDEVLRHAFLNSHFQTGFANPIDKAIQAARRFEFTGIRKLEEIPYDFIRKRLSVLVECGETSSLMITKGAFDNVLGVCTQALTPTGERVAISSVRETLLHHFMELSQRGYRVLGLAVRSVEAIRIERSDEREMTFLGFLVFHDPPRADIQRTLSDLAQLGIQLKIITGDNRAVATTVCQQVGLTAPRIMTGSDLRMLSEEALVRRAPDTDLFAEVEPNQKERIILALKKSGHSVGYLGDGINDASALHAADVGISVASAVDVAREAAQVVLLKPNLNVLVEGVREGRRTFANTLKYVFVSLSANFGYMFSMAAASLFLPFLPLLPAQILLINLLADFPAMALATDSVDPELIARPRRWDVKALARFMLLFGFSGSCFDFLTFGVLLGLYRATIEQFRTGWFMVSILTGLIIMLAVRTQRPFFRSRPGRLLLGTAAIIAGITFALPYSPAAAALELSRPTPRMLAIVFVIAALYGTAMETIKRFFYRRTAK